MASFVRTASVFVDNVNTPEEADAAVRELNKRFDGEIILADDQEHPWERSSEPREGEVF